MAITLVAVALMLLASPSQAEELSHVVGKGQWLEVIAKRYHTTAAAIRAHNGLSRRKKIRVGQRLRILVTKEHRRWMRAYEKRTGKKAPGRANRSATARVLEEKGGRKTTKKKRRQRRKLEKRKRDTRAAKQLKRRKALQRKAKAKAKAKAKRRAAAAKREALAKRKAAAKREAAAKRKAQAKREATAKRKAAAKRKAKAVAKAEQAARRRANKDRSKLFLSKEDRKFRRRPRRRGYVTVVRYGERFRGQLRNKNGKIRKYARKRLTRILRSLRARKQHPINKRLLGLLARVSDYFGGRTIEIVSGFRPFRPKQYTRNSRHNHGEAIDFRIVGVPNRVLWRYCLSLKNVGCGYYPNSTFVHIDVRDHKTHWIDYSGPGQRPRYAHKMKKKRSGGAARTRRSQAARPPARMKLKLSDKKRRGPPAGTAKPVSSTAPRRTAPKMGVKARSVASTRGQGSLK